MQQDAPGLWQVVLQDAIDKTDPRLARTKLIKAEFAVFNRRYGFVSSANASYQAPCLRKWFGAPASLP
jgi:hypothetical protein